MQVGWDVVAEFPRLILLLHRLNFRQSHRIALGCCIPLYKISHHQSTPPNFSQIPRGKDGIIQKKLREQTTMHIHQEPGWMSWEQIIAASRPERGSKLMTYNLTGHLFHLLFKCILDQAHKQHLQSMPTWNCIENINLFSTRFATMTWDTWIFPRNPCAVSPWATFTKNDQANSPRMTVGILHPLPVLFLYDQCTQTGLYSFQRLKKIKRGMFHDTWKVCKVQISVSMNKVLREPSQSYSFSYCLWLLSPYKSRVGYDRPKSPCKFWNIY